MRRNGEAESALAARVAKQYEEKGYKVFLEPTAALIPFDIGSYRPDLLAVKADDDAYIVEVKGRAADVSVDRFRAIAELVDQHPGWHFVLVTGDDLAPNELEAKSEQRLLTRAQVLARKAAGEKLIRLGELDAAFITLWGALEAIMRRQAEHASIPIERFPTSSLINHLYSQGELSIEQFDTLRELLSARNQFAHGFQAPRSRERVERLERLLSELLDAGAFK